MRAPDLADLELAYAPMYGSAKDPVNQLGYVAERAGGRTCPRRLARDRGSAFRRVDRARRPLTRGVRRRERAGAINVPLDELRSRLGEVPDGPVVTLCAVGQRGHAAAELAAAPGGRTVANLSGGYTTWIGDAVGARTRDLIVLAGPAPEGDGRAHERAIGTGANSI
ncbi:MAG: hypothetical protein R2715_22920 [Ilumatobacteraceae bacterium]